MQTPNPIDETLPLERWPSGSSCYREGTAGAFPGTPDEEVPGFKGRTLRAADGRYLAWRWLAPVKQYRFIGKFDHFLVAMGRM